MADQYNPADAFQLLYQHHLKARRVTDCRIYTTNKRKAEEETHDQEQYLTEYEPLIMEKWAIPYSAHIDYHLDTQRPISREQFTDASCEICCDPSTHEDPHEDKPSTDMYECKIRKRTYHWRCLVELQCYTDEQRREIIVDDSWSCPACEGLSE